MRLLCIPIPESQIKPMMKGYYQAMLFSNELEDGKRAGSVDYIIFHRCSSFRFLLEDRYFPLFKKLFDLVTNQKTTWEDVGANLYYDSYGHGTGFWDKKELEENNLGEKLSKIVDKHFDLVGAVGLYKDDDGKLCL